MARVIQEFIKRPLAEELLFGKLVNGGHVEVTLSEEGDKLKLESHAASDKGSDETSDKTSDEAAALSRAPAP